MQEGIRRFQGFPCVLYLDHVVMSCLPSHCSLCEECVEWKLLLPQDCVVGPDQVPRWSDASRVLCEWGCDVRSAGEGDDEGGGCLDDVG